MRKSGSASSSLVMVGDRGMITQTQIDELREMDGIDWITALRPEPIRKLINDPGDLRWGYSTGGTCLS